jgi:hypothetical protein
MPRRPFLPVLLASCAAWPVAGAAELGEATVKSYLGQPMIVDIELLPEEGGAVQAAVARAGVYEAASLRMPAVLATAHLSVMRRDGHQYLHVTTIDPVERPPVHLFLDLAENGKHSVREVTLWFVPDPHPAPPPAPEPVATAPVARPVHHAQPAPAAPAESAAAAQRACAALDYKNGELSAQIVDLEEKVKVLQAAIDSADPKPAAPQAPRKPAAAAAPLHPAMAEAETPKKKMPAWLVAAGIIAAALAGLGAAGWALRKKIAHLRGEPGGALPGFLDRFRKHEEPEPQAEAAAE